MQKEDKIITLLDNLLYLKSTGVSVHADNIYSILTSTNNYFYENNLREVKDTYDKDYLNRKVSNDKEYSKGLKEKYFGKIKKKFNFKESKKRSLFSKKTNSKTLYVKDEIDNHYLYLDQGDVYNNKDSLKLYVGLKDNNFLDNIEKVYNFISTNEIDVHSKISKRFRLDNLVIRVNNIEDAQKLIEHINKNISKYETNNINPFTLNEGIVGITKDSDESYNFEVSKLINQFVEIMAINENFNLDKKIILQEFKKIVYQHKMGTNNNEINRLLMEILEGHNGLEIFNKTINSKDFNNNYNTNQVLSIETIQLNKAQKEVLEFLLRNLYETKGTNYTIEAISEYTNTGSLNMFGEYAEMLELNNISKELFSEYFKDLEYLDENTLLDILNIEKNRLK